MNFEIYELMQEVAEIEFSAEKMNEIIDVVINEEKHFESRARESAVDQISLSQAFSL
ncbi:TPA: hypothetical protein I3317_004866 [Enterobacter cloacae subsp. cloacae]|uniref:hypothetical protein n=1 Tax=Enterobacter cloacae TaxID=550 RepID=UPI0020054B78|nr:hypothetical protein [Enterobacter cloacae]MCK6721123.1 hypothetical protein [Enterobacter cloacae]HAS0825006.1 hypothetical protein [Enterobacter cloacae subsp. cloacae]